MNIKFVKKTSFWALLGAISTVSMIEFVEAATPAAMAKQAAAPVVTAAAPSKQVTEKTGAEKREKTSQAAATQTKTSLGRGLVKEKPSSGRFVKTDQGYMVAYKETVPGTKITFEMIPIAGGTFLMGSPADEENRLANEGTQTRIAVEPFWMAKHELTWGEYHAYMKMYLVGKSLSQMRIYADWTPAASDELIASAKTEAARKSAENIKADFKKRHDVIQKIIASDPVIKRALAEKPILKDGEAVDAVTVPTPLYEPSTTYQSGEEENRPAVTMTPYAAQQYTKWLSALTGQEYRLPCEAEWEYAARAGTTTAYSYGDDPEVFEEYGWNFDNGDDITHPVGEKKPNPWGLHDMHGNVAEIVLDEYREKGFTSKKKVVPFRETINWPVNKYPRTVRGGSWGDDVELCRSAAKIGTNDTDWKSWDPNFPLSPWWYTTDPAGGVGMRIIRPLKPMTKLEKRRVWDSETAEIADDVRERVEVSQRGTVIIVNDILIEVTGKFDTDKELKQFAPE